MFLSRPSGHSFSRFRQSRALFFGGGCMKKIGIEIGSDSDLLIIKKAVNVINELEVSYEVYIYSSHRTPEQACDFAKNA